MAGGITRKNAPFGSIGEVGGYGAAPWRFTLSTDATDKTINTDDGDVVVHLALDRGVRARLKATAAIRGMTQAQLVELLVTAEADRLSVPVIVR